jgi:magnesium transporter
VPSYLIDGSGVHEVEPSRDVLETAHGRGDFYWLDLHGLTDEQIDVLGEVYGFHPLSLDDARHFGQRPKLDPYDGYVFLVAYGSAPDQDQLVEVHCFYSERFLVTVRRDPCPAFAEARDRHARRPTAPTDPPRALYKVVDGLVDSFFPALSHLDEFIDAIEEGVLASPTEEQMRRVFEAKRRLVGLRRVIDPQRDVMATIANGVAEIPGADVETERLFRDVYDHLIRLTDAIDSFRDLLTSLMDVYLSTVSNRLNGVMKQLTVIATIFLPLTFVTGFFGQNFGWMVDHVGSLWTFVVLGVGTQLIVLGFLLAFFRRREWF